MVYFPPSMYLKIFLKTDFKQNYFIQNDNLVSPYVKNHIILIISASSFTLKIDPIGMINYSLALASHQGKIPPTVTQLLPLQMSQLFLVGMRTSSSELHLEVYVTSTNLLVSMQKQHQALLVLVLGVRVKGIFAEKTLN